MKRALQDPQGGRGKKKAAVPSATPNGGRAEPVVMQKHPHVTLERIEKFLSPVYFADVNLCADLVKKRSQDAVTLGVCSYTDRIPFEQAVKGSFRETKVGEAFNPTWSTHWFTLLAKIPADWAGEPVELIWDSNSEAMVWDEKGNTLQAFTGGTEDTRRVEFTLTEKCKGGEVLHFYIEMACSGLFGAGKDGMINAPDPKKSFTLATAELIIPNRRAAKLHQDVKILYDLAKEFPTGSLRARQALFAANAIVNVHRLGDHASYDAAEEIVADYFKDTNGTSQHTISAVGHCHIDTAWLWPYDETKRKCARSWTTQCDLIEKYPGYKFIASQAQQFEWIEQLYPKLFQRIQKKVKEGTFIVTGATWVEMDCNLPSGESFVRQFLYGQKFFESRFGQKCKVFWLPDTFGYSSQLPQIIKQAGAEYFLTQKLSWNLINKFPHTTFFWKGLDGTKVLTHFPPSDTYNAHVTVKQTAMCVTNHKDVDRSNQSMMLFGHGDGGGGPTWDMIHRAQRFQDLDGLPKIQLRSPDAFFQEVKERDSHRLVTWDGELYFELHRGTYTSQANNKLQNRKNEFALQCLEMLWSLGVIHGHGLAKEKKEEIDRLWKLLLLNQFHDVIPGTSIGAVFDDSRKHYEDIGSSVRNLVLQHWELLTAGKANPKEGPTGFLVFNPTPFTYSGFVQLGQSISPVTVDPFAVLHADTETASKGSRLSQDDRVKVNAVDSRFSLENSLVSAAFDALGRLTSFVDKKTSREIIPTGSFANVFRYYEDIPLFWDAWDVEVYHLEKGWDVNHLNPSGVIDPASSPEVGSLRFSLKLSETSKLVCTVSLAAHSALLKFACDVDWNENRRFLKVEFPVNIRSDFATYDVQFGVLRRPTHYNTSWDLAKFEVCGHKFADFSEYGYGVALLNDSKYGYAVRGNVMALSLLRSPKAPDDRCDIGHHRFQYALFPHEGSFESSRVIEEARHFNVPPSVIPVSLSEAQKTALCGSYFRIQGAKNLVLDTIKPSEKNSSVLIVRVHEVLGGRGAGVLLSDKVKILEAEVCDLLEESKSELACSDDGSVVILFSPFQITTLRLKIQKKV